jgi:hypothetical protein
MALPASEGYYVNANDEALMVYSSFHHALDGALVWTYGADAQSMAVGSTASTGNAETDAKFGPLNWEEFSRDLIIASHFSKLVGVYNLEGCISAGIPVEAPDFEGSTRLVCRRPPL